MNFEVYKLIHTAFNDVEYYDDIHAYYSKGVKGMSVTTLKKKFMEEFDQHYWSVHEALKRKYPGDVLSHARKNISKDHISVKGQLAHVDVWALSLKEEVTIVLDEWGMNSRAKRIRGSQIHRYLELGTYGKFESKIRIEACDRFLADKAYQIPIAMEFICASPCRRIMGQGDRLVYDPIYDWIELSDFKTDESITFKDPYGKKLKGPFSYMDHTEGNSYIIQLNSYRTFLESVGIPIGRMAIYNIREAENTYLEVEIPRIDIPLDVMIDYDNTGRDFYSTNGIVATASRS